MTDAAVGARTADSSRFLPIMLVLFAGSGCSALIYEIVWFQLLSLAIGATAVSIGVLLATFMGGLCLGSYLLPRLFGPGKRDVHPLRLYAYIELGIGLLGLVVLGLIPLIDQFYIAGPQYGAAAMVMRAVFCAVAILPPTILMGASLPAIARWAKATPKGVSWWGWFYGINTGGAVVGSLLAGFYLLRVYDIYVATLVAVAINIGVAALSYFLAFRIPASSGEEPAPEPAPAKPARSRAAKAAAEPEVESEAEAPRADDAFARWCVLVAVALSGACSMGAQVVWTRLMGLMLGATVYVFSIILGVFLIGLGIGAAVGAALARRGPAKVLLGWSQILAALGLAWTAFQISMSLPDWPVAPLPDTEPHIIFQLDLIRCLWALLPATFFWGAAVPLAFAAATRRSEDPGKTVGGVYAANTLGAIAGALLVSLLAIPLLGTQTTQRIVIILSALSGLIALAPVLRGREVGNYALAGLAAAIVAAPTLALGVPKTSAELIAYGRRTASYNNQYQVLESHEGQNTSIAITRWHDGSIQFHVAGKVEASDNPYDMRLQRMLGYLPILFHPNPKSVLIVGFGAGVTAGAFMTYPTMDRIVICEMEPKIPPTTTKWFGRQNHNVLNAPKTQIYYDDARHYVLTTKEKFDIITSDPIHPFVKGSASLYSLEYWRMLRDRLNPGGVVTQWIPLYESDFETVKSEIATFFEVFPYATVWANLQDGQGYDLALIGHNQPLTIDAGAVSARLATPAYGPMRQDLVEVGFPDVQSLLDIYSGDKRGLVEWLRGAQINRDSSLRLQYLAGLSLNRQLGDVIYKDMLLHKSPPTGVTIISPPAPALPETPIQ